MLKESRLQELMESVKKAYGSLDEPNYSFMEKRYQTLRCHPFVLDIMSMYFVKNETDLNDHVSLHLEVLHKDGSMLICLSFVDNWAMLFRLKLQNQTQVEILETSSTATVVAEREVMNLLSQFKFKLISREEAATPIDMNLCDTDRSEARLYHAIISDDGTVPIFLFTKNNEQTDKNSRGGSL